MKIVYFHGFPCNPELYEWLTWFERAAVYFGFLQNRLDVTQLIGGAAASGGTHSRGWAFDIWNMSWGLLWLARQMGAPATWIRFRWQGFVPHTHGVLDPVPAGHPAAYQTTAVKDGYNGLGKGGRAGKDDGPRPLVRRTWREGIEWAKQQMALPVPQLPEGEDEMILFTNVDTKAVYTISHGAITHITDGERLTYIRNVLTTEDHIHEGTEAQFRSVLQAAGLSDAKGSTEFAVHSNGTVRDGETGEYVRGGTFSWAKYAINVMARQGGPK